MPLSKKQHLRDLARATLMSRAGRTPDSAAVGAAVLGTWELTAEQLTTLIGPRAVSVLLLRALHLASAEFPFLAQVAAQGNEALPALQAGLSERLPGEAMEIGISLIVAFNELLATLIGVSLSERLMTPVWAQLPRTNEEKTH
jgi:hypothetical protein